MKVLRLSALRTGRLYLQEVFLVLISVRSGVDGVMSMKHSKDISDNRPRDLTGLAQCLNQLCLSVPSFLQNAVSLNHYSGMIL
jgi:hypothetical protein